MANTFTPYFAGNSFAGELVYSMPHHPVADTIKKYIESVNLTYRNAFIVKQTGFETTKHVVNKITGNDTICDISITFVGNLPRWEMQQLIQLGKGLLGAGMQLEFHDDWITDKDYLCRWTNALDFVENSALLCGGTIELQAWQVTDIIAGASSSSSSTVSQSSSTVSASSSTVSASSSTVSQSSSTVSASSSTVSQSSSTISASSSSESSSTGSGV
jgi:hypothetical protein